MQTGRSGECDFLLKQRSVRGEPGRQERRFARLKRSQSKPDIRLHQDQHDGHDAQGQWNKQRADILDIGNQHPPKRAQVHYQIVLKEHQLQHAGQQSVTLAANCGRVRGDTKNQQHHNRCQQGHSQQPRPRA